MHANRISTQAAEKMQEILSLRLPHKDMAIVSI